MWSQKSVQQCHKLSRLSTVAGQALCYAGAANSLHLQKEASQEEIQAMGNSSGTDVHPRHTCCGQHDYALCAPPVVPKQQAPVIGIAFVTHEQSCKQAVTSILRFQQKQRQPDSCNLLQACHHDMSRSQVSSTYKQGCSPEYQASLPLSPHWV